MQRLLILLCLLASFSTFSQNDTIRVKNLKGQIIHAENKKVLSAAHVLNLNTVQGTITNDKGKFSMTAAVNDTLYFSFLGFKSQKIRVTNDMFKFEDTKISLTELAYALEEVIVRPYQLTGYLEIDVKNLPINSAYQYSISGLGVSYEAGNKSPSAVTKVLGAILNPADLLRNLFGKKPNQGKERP